MKVRPSVFILENQHVLLMQYKYGNTDVYNLPGGNPDAGETLEETLVRELREELGVEIELGEMLLSGEVILPEQKTDVLHVVFAAQIIGGIPILNQDETTSIGISWKKISELAELNMYPNVGSQLMDLIIKEKSGLYIGKIPQKWHN